MAPKSRNSEPMKNPSVSKLTINDRILLHLLDHLQAKNKREAPFSITQKGIAEGVGIRWNHVPRAMSRLKKMGYVSEEMSHIEAKTRRQKAYFLTDDGMLIARNLRERILNWEIKLKKTDGQVVIMKLSEVNHNLKTNFSPFKLFMNLSDEGTIHADDLLEGKSQKPKEDAAKIFFVKGEIEWPAELIGRKYEMKTVSQWMDSRSVSTVVIYGSVGIGKSALMAEIIRSWKNKKNIFWYEMTDSDSQKDILSSLSEFLTDLKSDLLSTYLKDHDKTDLNDILRVLEKGLEDKNTILAFDNYFQVSEDVADLFGGFCELAANNSQLKLLINALDTTPFYCRFYDKNEVKKKKIAELTIKGLDQDGIRRMLKTPKIDDEALLKIYQMTRGHPLTIELIKKGDVNSLKRIKGFSRQEASLLLYLKTVEGN